MLLVSRPVGEDWTVLVPRTTRGQHLGRQHRAAALPGYISMLLASRPIDIDDDNVDATNPQDHEEVSIRNSSTPPTEDRSMNCGCYPSLGVLSECSKGSGKGRKEEMLDSRGEQSWAFMPFPKAVSLLVDGFGRREASS